MRPHSLDVRLVVTVYRVPDLSTGGVGGGISIGTETYLFGSRRSTYPEDCSWRTAGADRTGKSGSAAGCYDARRTYLTTEMQSNLIIILL